MKRFTIEKIRRLREKCFAHVFGRDQVVNTDVDPSESRVDVMVCEPSVDGDECERNFYTYVTIGLSDRSLQVSGDAPRRLELLVYANTPDESYVDFLRLLARVPLAHPSNFLNFGTTMRTGTIRLPGLTKDFVSIVFLIPLLVKDAAIPEVLEIDGEPVHMLWPVPITEPEESLIRSKGIDVFLRLLETNQHSIFIDEPRESYV